MADEYEFSFIGKLTVSPEYDGEQYDEAEELERVFDATMEAILDLDDAVDPSVSGSIAQGVIEVELTVEAEDFPSAAASAHGIVRTALHTAGVSTKNWKAGGVYYADFRKVTTIDPALDEAEDCELAPA